MPTTALTQAGEWNDSQTPGFSMRPGGTAPTLNPMNGTIEGDRYSNNDEANGSLQLAHSAINGGELRVHVHFTTATAITIGQTFVWGLEYAIAPVNGVFPAPTTVTATYVIPDVTALRHRILGITTITLPTPAASAILMFRVFRSNTGTSAVNPFLLSLDGHFQQGNYGTEAEF